MDKKIKAAIAGVIAFRNEEAEFQEKMEKNIWGKAGRRRIMESNYHVQKRRVA